MRMLNLLIATSLSSNALADCVHNLDLCDAAVNKQQVVITEQSKQITNYEQMSSLDRAIIQHQQEQLDSPFRDPVKVAAGTVVVIIVLEIVFGAFKK